MLYLCFTGQVVHENPNDDSMVIIDDVPKTNDANPAEPNQEDDFDSVSMTNSYKYVYSLKVLLRERKTHTARCVSNTTSVVLSWEGGYPVPGTGGGNRSPGWGVPHPWTGGTLVPGLEVGVPLSWPGGTPSLAEGTPVLTWLEGYPIMGYPSRCGLTNKLKLIPSPSFGCRR